jgi:hypothetical protein
MVDLRMLSPRALASWLARLSDVLQKVGGLDRCNEAGQLARELIRMPPEVVPSDDWVRFAFQSLLGGALIGQARDPSVPDELKLVKLMEAESELLTAAERMLPPPNNKRLQLEAFERLVLLYDTWHALDPKGGFQDRAAGWRARVANWEASSRSSSGAEK